MFLRLAFWAGLFVAGFTAAERFERRGEGTLPALGPSLAVQRDAAKADLALCRADAGRLNAALSAQSAAVERHRAEGERRLADAARALDVARRSAPAAQAAAARLAQAPPAGAMCDRVAAVDALVLETLR